MKLSKILLLAIISTFIHLISFGQNNKDDTIKIVVGEMARNDVYERSYSIGYFGSYSKQLELFEKLKSIATEEQLLKLAEESKSAIVRLYAFQALKEKKTKIPESIARKFTNDNTEVTVLWGCFGDKKTVKALAFKTIIKQQNELLPSQASIEY
ncbi:hypothetical protein [Segetibacter aerophilus]|uniref:Uncharacterized protein n=1 Tax=Segetibacter aerophilus TaxID=670293 RepID=A0A512B722_9BACT|nr:hypothetical protein [Segetibacter aerophilus]GEO07761.1 hypothetical protein SAE01_02570 [Segetibacter aerophilus]